MVDEEIIQDPTGGDPGKGETVEGAEPTPEPEPKKDNLQKRFDTITRKMHDLERQNEYLRGIAEGAAMREAPRAPNGPANPQPSLKPDDFPSYEDYIRAEAKEETKRGIEAAKQDLLRERQAQDRERRAESYRKQYAAAAEKYEDFNDIALDPSLAITQQMIEAAEGESFTDILYYLGKNRGEAQRIAMLSPLQVAREIGKIEMKLQNPKADVTKAPEPIDQISSGGNPATAPTLEKMSRKERFAAWEEERLKRGRGG